MNKDDKKNRNPVIMNCSVCDLKPHYRYTREEIMELHHPKRKVIKPCKSDFCMDVLWINYKLEDEVIPD